jgi:hypothetical protein
LTPTSTATSTPDGGENTPTATSTPTPTPTASNTPDGSTFTPTPTITPSGPILTPTSTITPGGPTLTPTVTPTQVITEGVITPKEGGDVTTKDGTFDLDFPPGGVTQNVVIHYESLYAPSEALNNNRSAVLSFLLTAEIEGTGEPVTEFAEPYTLTLDYTDDQLSQLSIEDEQSLNIIFWDEGSSSWTDVLPCAAELNCVLNTEQNFVSIQLDHLTEFALVGEAVEEHNILYLPLIVK